jgi:cell division protein FtsQ
MAKKRPRRNKNKKRSAERLRQLKQRAGTALLGMGACVVVLLVSALFILMHDVLMDADSFPVEQIKITGAGRLSRDTIARRAGVRRGDNILAVNLSKVRKRLISHPWIAKAQVRRNIPAGLSIRIREHQGLAIVDLGDKFLLNHEGRLFKAYQPGTDPGDLPVIQGLSASDVAVAAVSNPDNSYSWPGSAEAAGPGFTSSHGPMEAVMQILNLGRPTDSTIPNRKIRQIIVDRSMGVTLYAFKQTKIIQLGYDDYPRKYRMLATILAQAKRNRLVPDFTHIDLQDINRIVITPIKQDPSE